MNALRYEVRRLRGLRSTWLITIATLAVGAVAAAVRARQAAPGPLGVPDAVRAVTAVVPWLPLPVTALAAGLVGALSYADEVRHPGLPASMVALRRRLVLLAAKCAVTAAVSVVLAAGAVLLDAAVLALVRPDGVVADVVRPQTPAEAGLPLAMFAALVVLAGWAGLLATAVARSSLVGLGALVALPVVVGPFAGLLPAWAWTGRDRPPPLPAAVRSLWPDGVALPGRPVSVPWPAEEPGVFLVLLAPPVLLLAVVAVLGQLRRRAM